jgi:hypothetical protein
LKKGFRSYDEFPAGKNASSLLPNILKEIKKSHDKKFHEVEKIWQEIVGEKYASMTKVIKIDGDILFVKVSSTPLFAILSVEERGRLEREIQNKIPFLKLKTIVFRR